MGRPSARCRPSFARSPSSSAALACPWSSSSRRSRCDCASVHGPTRALGRRGHLGAHLGLPCRRVPEAGLCSLRGSSGDGGEASGQLQAGHEGQGRGCGVKRQGRGRRGRCARRAGSCCARRAAWKQGSDASMPHVAQWPREVRSGGHAAREQGSDAARRPVAEGGAHQQQRHACSTGAGQRCQHAAPCALSLHADCLVVMPQRKPTSERLVNAALDAQRGAAASTSRGDGDSDDEEEEPTTSLPADAPQWERAVVEALRQRRCPPQLLQWLILIRPRTFLYLIVSAGAGGAWIIAAGVGGRRGTGAPWTTGGVVVPLSWSRPAEGQVTLCAERPAFLRTHLRTTLAALHGGLRGGQQVLHGPTLHPRHHDCRHLQEPWQAQKGEQGRAPAPPACTGRCLAWTGRARPC